MTSSGTTLTGTTGTTPPSEDELAPLRELADDLFGSITDPLLNVPDLVLPYSPDAWRLLEESGLALLTTSESAGGSGASAAEAAVVLDRAGYHALPAPLAETDLLAAWLLDRCGADIPAGPMTAAIVSTTTAGHHVADVPAPWLQVAGHLVVAGPGFIARSTVDRDEVIPVGDLAGQHGGRVHLDPDGVEVLDASSDVRDEFVVRGAWARSAQICGALERALDLAIAHVTERHQFGRPIGKFQAVQELIACSAGALTTAKAASAHATAVVDAHGFDSDLARTAVAVAKIQAGHAATSVSRDVHQAHGAIGFTLDHQLRHFTSRALAWNRDFGLPLTWEKELGRRALASGDTLWEFVVRR